MLVSPVMTPWSWITIVTFSWYLLYLCNCEPTNKAYPTSVCICPQTVTVIKYMYNYWIMILDSVIQCPKLSSVDNLNVTAIWERKFDQQIKVFLHLFHHNNDYKMLCGTTNKKHFHTYTSYSTVCKNIKINYDKFIDDTRVDW